MNTPRAATGHRFAFMTSIRSAAIALAAVLGLTLTACTASSSDDSDLPPEAQVQLSPQGGEGAWLTDAYAAGFDAQYATANEVCAVTDDMAIEVERGVGGDSTVMGRQLRGGQLLWEIDDATCGQGALLPGDPDSSVPAASAATVVVGSRWQSGMRAWSLVDPATGTERQALGLGPEVASAQPVAWAGTRVVVRTGVEDLVGLDMGTGEKKGSEVWRSPVAAGSEVTVLADDLLGVTNQRGKRITVLDLESGEVRLSTAVTRPDWITWASDGYVEKIQETDPEYAFVDLDGREVDRTTGVSQYTFVPQPREGVTFPLSDHRQAGTVVGVDATGTPALTEDAQRRIFTRSGEIAELPDSLIILQGVSADGSLLLFPGTPDGLVLIDDAGEKVASWPLGYSELRIESGLIVIRGESGTSVLLPGEV